MLKIGKSYFWSAQMTLTIERLWKEADFSPNSAQAEAIKQVEDPLFLPAGPGSGKMRGLLRRTVNLKARHNIKLEVLFLSTFTEKAAFRLKQGLTALLGLVTNFTNKPYGIAEIYIGTVHSFTKTFSFVLISHLKAWIKTEYEIADVCQLKTI
ncbi:MAG TPA: UvrD-helicase domain-containing protein [Pyrinomonadaceae bacterium]|jgi:DNA helicase-2/ATP-dependent DNA helicase PcrA|nr:UvrD-helicase domain-containing protein [Pyrinomonadaceae bacterium]